MGNLKNTTYERQTTYDRQSQGPASGLMLSVFDGSRQPRLICLDDFKKPVIYFGRGPENDIVLNSHLVSAIHGRFVYHNGLWQIQDKGVWQETGSTNGLIYNNMSIASRELSDGDVIRIDDGIESVAQGVLFVVSRTGAQSQWFYRQLSGKAVWTIGRAPESDIILSHVTVSKCHARILWNRDAYWIEDMGSSNGVIVNQRRISGKEMLHEKDVITITNTKLIFTHGMIFYCTFRSGISVDVSDIVVRRGRGRKGFVTCDHASLHVKPGELVAIVGGSGAGKSTLLNAMCGYLKPDAGNVFINGVPLYENFDALKKVIGYVPQSDIVYDNLTLHDMLMYTAKLRLPADTGRQDREAAIGRALDMVELSEKAGSLIRNLSGGQKKRASIAVELLSDPSLLFLDEPASGLDPGTERSLMGSLRKMADSGKTIILVTHSTLQLEICDKLVFMGKGGKLCFYGPCRAAMEFFHVSDVVDIYSLLSEQAQEWSRRFAGMQATVRNIRPMAAPGARGGNGRRHQLGVLSARYMKLVFNDRQRLLLLFVQAPLLAVLIALVANGKQFEQYEMTKSLLFALSCCAFWIGMLNAIQEVCKEQNILKREYMTGLSLNSYILSKLLVLGGLCLIQSGLVGGVFALLVGLPKQGVWLPPLAEIFVTTFLTALSAAAMGLFVSALFNNADRAMTVAPILLMPQILFSGLIFKLSGATEMISWIAVCRWSMEGYGTTANLNALPLKLQQEGVAIPHDPENYFDFSIWHLLGDWLILVAFIVIFLGLARIVLSRIGKEKA